MLKPLKRIKRAEVKAVTMALLVTQNWKCVLCGKAIDPNIVGNRSDYVLDHNHETGEIRGVLHRSCNSAEGKALQAIGSWGSKSKKYKDVIPFVEALLAYWKSSNGTGLMYPDHKTPTEQKAAQLLKARKAYAAKKAAKAMKPKVVKGAVK